MAVNSQPCGQPDISYYPDIVKYRKRTERRLKNEDLETNLRRGLPQKIDSPAAWDSSIAYRSTSWLYHLSTDDIKEINQALASFQGKQDKVKSWI